MSYENDCNSHQQKPKSEKRTKTNKNKKQRKQHNGKKDGMITGGNKNYDYPWDFRQPSKWRDFATFKGIDRLQSYHLAVQTELMHTVGLHNM
jgi:hypothetical protein